MPKGQDTTTPPASATVPVQAPVVSQTEALTAPVTNAESPEQEPEEQKPSKTWKENFDVKEDAIVDTVDRLAVHVGVNVYKGNHLIFLAKVTDKDFSRQFLAMPAYIWEKCLPIIQKAIPNIAKVERETMKTNAMKELQRLAELGVDIKALLAQMEQSKKP